MFFVWQEARGNGIGVCRPEPYLSLGIILSCVTAGPATFGSSVRGADDDVTVSLLQAALDLLSRLCYSKYCDGKGYCISVGGSGGREGGGH